MVREYRQRRGLCVPLAALMGLVIAILTGYWPLGVFCAIALGVSAVVVIPMSLLGRATLTDASLTVQSTPPYQRSQKHPGPVRLDHLVEIQSVNQRYGRFTRFGFAIMRPLIRLQDANGTDAVMWAWGWENKTELVGLLRQAALRSNAHVDGLTRRRLSINS